MGESFSVFMGSFSVLRMPQGSCGISFPEVQGRSRAALLSGHFLPDAHHFHLRKCLFKTSMAVMGSLGSDG